MCTQDPDVERQAAAIDAAVRSVAALQGCQLRIDRRATDLPGCVATGATPEEATVRKHEAIDLHIQGLREDQLPIPEPSATAAYVEVGP